MNDKKKDPVIHVSIMVTQEVNPANGELELQAKYTPEVIPVTESDTIINFKLDPKCTDDIYIKTVSYDPKDNDQLSAPSISQNKRQVTLSDVNTVAETIYLSFQYGRKKDKELEARAMLKDGAGEQADLYPQIINEPPP